MKFFIDTANVEDIKKANDMGVICGVTTNPSLIAKELIFLFSCIFCIRCCPTDDQLRFIFHMIGTDRYCFRIR